ncbi:MAG: 2-C-methyl-D-erythritol 2,4-cyclodiphosphate synthase [Kiritimatiellae bacterium]|nr:2-C-methyl-D-erythritol 2,4-cyclodiphosphate synthase [Kiritimatiellia bacterium]
MIRFGLGNDAHRLVPDRKLILGGVEIPYELGLLGHSDADVLAHAISDALLGALALGDIGKYFPDTDPKWKGADSLKLLGAVVDMLKERCWHVVNIDATVLCERPKLAPHIVKMRENIAAVVGVDVDCISVKATTVEGMGAIGRKEGISVMAIAAIEKI